jgi:hypothetical protein
LRLESARSRPGFGLGLSLAAAVARLHGGALRLEDNAPGLRAVLELPMVARPQAAPADAPMAASAHAPIGSSTQPLSLTHATQRNAIRRPAQ